MTKKSENARPLLPSGSDAAGLVRVGLDHLQEWEKSGDTAKGVLHLQAAFLAARAVEQASPGQGTLSPPLALFIRRCYAAMEHYARTFFKNPNARTPARPLRTRESIADALRADYQATRLQQAQWDAGTRKTKPRSEVADKVNARVAKACGASPATVHRTRVGLMGAFRPPVGTAIEAWFPPSAEPRQWAADMRLIRHVEAWTSTRVAPPARAPKKAPLKRLDFSSKRPRERK